MKLMLQQWESYRAQVVPAEASNVQVEECRRAFYAGASACYHSIIKMLDPGSEPTDADLQKMDDLHNELLDFLGGIASQAGLPPQS